MSMHRFLTVVFNSSSVINLDTVFRKSIGPCCPTHLKLKVCSFGGSWSIISQAWKYYWMTFSEQPLGETSSSIVKSITRRLWKCSIFSPRSVIPFISKLLPVSLRLSSLETLPSVFSRQMKSISIPCIALNFKDKCFNKPPSSLSRSWSNFWIALPVSVTITGVLCSK